jgi:hypothetical protein
MFRWILIALGKPLDRISECEPARVLVIMNRRSISLGLMKDAQNYVRRNEPDSGGYGIQMK